MRLGARKNNALLRSLPHRLPHTRHLRAYLRRGGVIAYATESCFGLGCDPSNRVAVQRILQLKRRPQRKGLILVGSEVQQFRRYLAPISNALRQQLPTWWPGPTTLLLPASKHCSHGLRGRHENLAVRVSAHADTYQLCHALRMALVSTSANQAGKRSIKTARACQRQFGQQVRVLAGRIGRRKTPSRIIDPLSGKTLRG